VTKREIEDVIDELRADMLVTVVAPERERPGRRPSARDLAPPDNDPRVLVDSSLLTDVERRVECKPQTMAVGTIPPPVGPYCVLESPTALVDTDRMPRVPGEEFDELDLGELDFPEIDVLLDED